MSFHRNTAVLVLSLAVAFGAVLPSAAQTAPPAKGKAGAAGSKPKAASPGTKAAEGTAPSADASVVITLERTACFGTCPAYKVTIRGDGSVVYEGKGYVRVKGEQHGKVSREDVARLEAMFESAQFFDLKDRYHASVTDNPTYRVTYERDGRSKTVEDYVGHHAGMPQAVKEIENEIDRIARTEQWVGGRDAEK